MLRYIHIPLAILGVIAALPASAQRGCTSILPAIQPFATHRVPMRPEDLAALRDIGPQDSGASDRPILTLSPDGSKLAFQLLQADPVSNSYCLAMVVLDLRNRRLHVVDQGGDLIRARITFRGKAGFETGTPITITPRWSPDGRWIAFLKRTAGTDQVWVAEADGGGSRPLTSSQSDIEDFRWNADGTALVFSTRPDLRVQANRIAHEGLSGFHYDDRFAPMSGNIPFPAGPFPLRYLAIDLPTSVPRPAPPGEISLFATSASDPPNTQASALSIAGRRARVLAVAGNPLDFTQRLVVEDNGATTTCHATSCTDRIMMLWWTEDGRKVRYIKREGPGFSTTAIYEWRPGRGGPKRLYSTEDELAQCVPSHDVLLCAREGSLQPRRVEQLDPASGKTIVLFDPNPEVAGLSLGRVERLHWTNAFGSQAFADLVYPVGYRPGTRYPLIVVQYNSRGFLRGGTGDEYPIQSFAGRGFAVLSFNRPWPADLSGGAKTYVDVDKANLKGFLYRRSVQSSLETVIHRLADRGIIDPKRIGITGLSDGSSNAQYALLHSTLFSAASISSCCWGPQTLALIGPQAAREFIYKGYPAPNLDGSTFWRQYSLAQNASSVTVPILVQASDDEYLDAVEAYAALREARAPIDLFVFPAEKHIKWQPAHRLSIYQRNLDWFEFWLGNPARVSPTRDTERRHWETLKSDIAQRHAGR